MLAKCSDEVNNLLNQLAYADIDADWQSGDNLVTVLYNCEEYDLADKLVAAGLEDYTIKDYQNENSSNGFAAIAFENPKTGEVGMSFRGTENLNSFVSDIGGVISGNQDAINSQIDMIDNISTAVTGDSDQAQLALQFYRENKSDNGNNFLYGHSKGGELAAEVFAEYYKEIVAVHVINPQPINWASLSSKQKAAFNSKKFDAIVVDGDLVWLLGGVPYKVRIVKNNKNKDGDFFGPHMLESASYDDNGQAEIEKNPYKDYKTQGVLGVTASTVITVVQGGYKFISSLFFKSEYITRDFSERSKQNMLALVGEVEGEKICDFTDWVGDRWYDFEDWIGTLDIRRYVNNTNEYHKKVIDKNNTTKSTIEKIFNEVNSIDSSYSQILSNILEQQKSVQQYARELGQIIYPGNGKFSADGMSSLDNYLKNIESQKVQSLKDQLVQDIEGRVVINEELLYEYVKKNPAQMTDAEKAAMLEAISLLKDTVVVYETLATVGTDKLGADVLNYVSWISESSEFESFSAVSAHYNDIYVNLLNYMAEQSEDANTFAASLATVGIGEGVLTVLGVETYENLKDIFGSDSFKIYAAKYKTEHSEEYFKKLEYSESSSLKVSGGLDDISKRVESWKEKTEEKLKDKDLYKEEKETKYYDKDGNEISEKDAPNFYKRQVTLGEWSAEKKASVSLYDGTFDTPLGGTATVTVGEAEAHAGISAGCYIIGKDGEQVFSPGVNAEVGVSVTGFNATYENQLLGNEMLGANVDGSVTALSASAEAELNVNFMGKDENGNVVFDPQVNVGVNAEAVLVEAEGSVGVNVLGGEVGVSGSVKVGVGAHADVGYKDGVFKCEIGASLGIGFDVGFEVDVGGMVDTVADAASSAWEGLKKGWNSLWG